jgi:hypothetical protein
MKLPAVRPQHIRAEDARVFHEDLWRAYTNTVGLGRLYIAATERGVQVDAKRIQDARHRFWRDRGFKLCCETASDGLGFYCWLEPKVEKAQAA